MNNFISKAQLVHGDTYDYSNVEYMNSSTKVKIICKEHGEFLQTPNSHLSNHGCNKCSILKNSNATRSNIKNFTDKAQLVHGDTYDYSNVEYMNNLTNVEIICKEHGVFLQTPKSHLRGCGCSKCGLITRADKKRSNTGDFIEKAKQVHGDTYDYSKVDYMNSYTKVKIICKEHGEFLQIPTSHLYGKRCPSCSVEDYRKHITSTTPVFIEKAREVHDDTYDYSKVDYTNNSTNVEIICKEHGTFLQTPGAHLQGSGCSKCGLIARADKKRSNTGDFIEKAKQVHGDTYDYSKVDYINATSRVIIICNEHGEFLQTPNQHLCGKKCSKCSGIFVKNTKDFIDMSNVIHDNKYDYSLVHYKKSNTHVTIICKEHGNFLKTPNTHLQGSGCSKCSNRYRLTTDEFIIKARAKHGDKYDYSKVNYLTSEKDIIIVCKEHGEFLQTPYVHLSMGCGCSRCAKCHKYTTPEFIIESKKIHGEKYDYSKTEYKLAKSKIKIICNIHGEFLQTASAHLCGKGCQMCHNKTAGKLYNILKSIYPSLLREFRTEWCKKKRYLPFDFCIPEYKIIIELDGLQHFIQVRNWKSPEYQFQNDVYKEKCANDNGYSVIRILQNDVFYDTYDWLHELQSAIKKLKNGDVISKRIYLCKKGEYDKFIHNI